MYVQINVINNDPVMGDEVCRLLTLYDEWKKDFHHTMNYAICDYFSYGGFYWIEKETWESHEESLRYDSDDPELIGFLAIEDWSEVHKKLDFIFIVEKERRKGYATKAVTQMDLEKLVNTVSTIQTPDGKAFIEAYIKRGIS